MYSSKLYGVTSWETVYLTHQSTSKIALFCIRKKKIRKAAMFLYAKERLTEMHDTNNPIIITLAQCQTPALHVITVASNPRCRHVNIFQELVL